MIYIIFLLIKPFSESSFPVDGGGVILEETMSIRIETFAHGVKVISQNFYWFAAMLLSKQVIWVKPQQKNK